MTAGATGLGGHGAQVPVASYLRRLEAVNFDVLHPSLLRREWGLPIEIARAAYSKQW